MDKQGDDDCPAGGGRPTLLDFGARHAGPGRLGEAGDAVTSDEEAVLPPTRAQGAVRLLRLHGTSVVDQLLSSVSNVLAVVLVARSSSEQDFGRFALAYAVLTVVVSTNRAWLGNRISLSSDDGEARARTARVLGGAVLLAPAVAVAVWCVAALLTGGGGVTLLVALAAPVVCLQDLVRFGSVASGRPGAAVASDGLWTACLVAPLLVGASLSASQAVAVWVGGALASALLGARLLRVLPRLRAGWGELARSDAVAGSLVFGRLVTAGASLVVLAVAAAVIGPAAAGALRGASTLMGPLNGVFALVGLVLTPVVVRRPRSEDRRACTMVGAGLLALVLLLGGLLLLLPYGVGRQVLGESWSAARAVLPWTVAEYALISATSAVLLAAKVRGAARSIAFQQTALAVTSVVAGVGAALVLSEARWVAAGLVLASAVSLLTGIWGLRRTGGTSR